MSAANDLFEVLYRLQREDEEHGAIDHVAIAIGVIDEDEDVDGAEWTTPGGAPSIYRKAYGAKAFDAREIWSLDWHHQLRRDRLEDLARRNRRADDFQLFYAQQRMRRNRGAS